VWVLHMESLPKEIQDGIRKSSTVRLQANLLKAGYDERQVEAMERTQLIVEWAQVLADGGPVVEKEQGSNPLTYCIEM